MDWFLYDKDKDKRFKIKAPSKACYSFFLKRCIINSGPICKVTSQSGKRKRHHFSLFA